MCRRKAYERDVPRSSARRALAKTCALNGITHRYGGVGAQAPRLWREEGEVRGLCGVEHLEDGATAGVVATRQQEATQREPLESE